MIILEKNQLMIGLVYKNSGESSQIWHQSDIFAALFFRHWPYKSYIFIAYMQKIGKPTYFQNCFLFMLLEHLKNEHIDTFFCVRLSLLEYESQNFIKRPFYHQESNYHKGY